jgi:hypothetical protein
MNLRGGAVLGSSVGGNNKKMSNTKIGVYLNRKVDVLFYVVVLKML